MSRACPGSVILAEYEAVLADGSRLPFSRSYDKNQPGRLLVQLLDRTSPDAVAREDGAWKAEGDPLATVETGFRLTAALRGNPDVRETITLAPQYDCMPRNFSFSGTSGGAAGMNGSDGPDITVRLGVIHSPFSQQLYLAAIQVDGGRQFYVVGDAGTIGSERWLSVATSGGSGATGFAGTDGMGGTTGSPGCPGERGGDGRDGTNGGAGGDGGDGGEIMLVLPADQPELARLVRAQSWGGSSGAGGPGGHGGRGGMGGQGLFDPNNQPCATGSDGSPGQDGLGGTSGMPGLSGVRTTHLAFSERELFGEDLPVRVGTLLQKQ